MHLVNLTTKTLKLFSLSLLCYALSNSAKAQENSPYSRYGIGDMAPNSNVINRAMGGISAGYSDIQGININNPAALGSIRLTMFDIGFDITARRLASNTLPDKFTSLNTNISYWQLAMPITPRKMYLKGNYWGLSFGMKPLSRINYKISKNERITNIDTLNTTYEGSGGVSLANVSTGVKIKNFSFGVTAGYAFGNKEFSTKRSLYNNDSALYARANIESKSRFSGLFLSAGIQYDIKMKKNGLLKLGASANFNQSLSGSMDKISETFTEDSYGNKYSIDTVELKSGVQGKVKIPGNYTAGFMYSDKNWSYGADIEFAQWKSYSYFGQADAVQNSMMFRAGAQYMPAKESTLAKDYWKFVKYRGGLYFSKDYVNLNGNRPVYGITAGASFPLTSLRRISSEYLLSSGIGSLNAGIDYGNRGNKSVGSFRENTLRFNIGVSINSRWFIKRKYD